MTPNLSQSKNTAFLNDFFRLNFKDLTDMIFLDPTASIYDDNNIIIRAYSIDENQKRLIGEEKINSGLIR